MSEWSDFAARLIALAPDGHQELIDDFHPDEPPPTLWMGQMGEDLAHHWRELPSDRLESIFQLVEAGMQQGSERLSTAIATGFIEALANEISGGRLSREAVEKLLGTESAEYLRAWDAFSLRGEL